jgi:hypothetical protein
MDYLRLDRADTNRKNYNFKANYETTSVQSPKTQLNIK